MRILIALIVLFAVPAQALELQGAFKQGGLVIGHTAPGAQVTLDGETVDVAADGAFVIGFGRDAKPHAVLKVVEPGGKIDEHALTIVKQDYKIQRIDGLPARKVTPKPEDVARIKADNAKIWGVRGAISPESRFLSGFRWPVTGPISGVFGSQRILNGQPKNPHNGVDVAAPEGTPIVAPADGVVALVHDDMFYTGKTVMIDHGLGLTTVYAHMDSIAVIEGQVVSQGDAIGTVGKTGRVTGAHLHWGMTWKSVHLDPMLATEPMPKAMSQK
ncbi:M23 family metallopeptidase [Magnetovibrio sp.]|uniref:M23 family metallopeptidase n=1 Tax=Magnetovibrio sp. TaxID=2024836 RepID=UPI002F931993